MLPRRSSVVKAAFFVAVCVISGVLFMSNTTPRLQRIWENWEMMNIDETQLRVQLRELTNELNVTFNSNNKTAVEIFRYVKAMRDQLPVNPHRFRFILQPREVCEDKDVFLLTYVHTAPSHHRRRAAIRQTWGNSNLFKHLRFRIIFLMGMPDNASIQDAVKMESDLYGDIVQENFMDSYRNLTFKAIMGLRWVSRHCRHAKYVLKADDDIFVNIFNVMNHLKSISQYDGTPEKMILCLVWYRMKVVRDPKSKWYIPRSEFYPDYFPTYCSGSAFMMSGDVIPEMYQASLKTPFFWVDDYYITGLLAQYVGVTHRRFNSVYSLSPKTFLDKFTEENKWHTLTFGHVHNLNWWYQVWDNVLKDHKQSLPNNELSIA